MPEKPEPLIFKTWIKKAAKREQKATGMPAKASLLLIAHCFAKGTATKKYGTCTANSCLELDQVEPLDPSFTPNEHDLKHSKGRPWEHLVDRPTVPGPLCCEVRGKQMVIAAGYHAVTINFGLEAHVIVMMWQDLEDILAGDRPGPNTNPAKAMHLRSFTIPDCMIESGTSTKTDRYMNIVAAFVKKTQAVVISDFARLIRLHIQSQPVLYQQFHLTVQSPIWLGFWVFPDGPDFILEPKEALQSLHTWCAAVIKKGPTSKQPIGKGHVCECSQNTSPDPG